MPQNMAKEMNLSETAFLNPFKEGFNLRWFTPAIEVDLWSCHFGGGSCSMGNQRAE